MKNHFCFSFYIFLLLTFFSAEWMNVQAQCQPPLNIRATSVGSNYSRIKWSRVPNAGGYKLQGRIIGAPEWISMRVLGVDSIARISNLKPNTDYEIQVMTYCNADLTDSSAWSDKIFIHTDFPCEAPTELSVDSITSTTAVLHWQGPLNSAKFTVRYKSNGENAKWKTIGIRQGFITSLKLTELIPGTKYQWTIMCNCLGNALNESPFVEPLMNFTTPIH